VAENSAAKVIFLQFRRKKRYNFYSLFSTVQLLRTLNNSFSSVSVRVSLVTRAIAKDIYRRRGNFPCVSGGIFHRRSTTLSTMSSRNSASVRFERRYILQARLAFSTVYPDLNSNSSKI